MQWPSEGASRDPRSPPSLVAVLRRFVQMCPLYFPLISRSLVTSSTYSGTVVRSLPLLSKDGHAALLVGLPTLIV